MKVEIYSKPRNSFLCPTKNLAEQKGYDLTYKMLDEDFSREELFETFLVLELSQIVDGEK